MEDGVFNGVELEVFEDCHALFAVDIEFDSEDFGGVNEFANAFVFYHEVSGDHTLAAVEILRTVEGHNFFARTESFLVREVNDFATVEYYRDFFLVADSLSGFFAEFCTGFGCKFESFHF